MTELYEKSLRTLEFPRVLEMLAGQCVTQEAKDRAMKLRPSTEEREVQRRWEPPCSGRSWAARSTTGNCWTLRRCCVPPAP